MYIASDNVTLENNVIAGNSARFRGSGVYIQGNAPVLYHNTLSGNSAGSGDDATGVYVAEASSTERAEPKLYNTIIANQPVGIYAKGDVIANVVLVDGVLWHNNDSNTSGAGTFFLTNEFHGAPLFANPTTGDFHISPGSAAIDHGLNSPVTKDIDAEPRFPGQFDLGADEYWAPGALERVFLAMVVW